MLQDKSIILTVLQILLVVLLLTGLFYKDILLLVQDWLNDPNYSHGFFIPFISAYIIWNKRERLRRLQKESSMLGLLVLGAGLGLYAVGNIIAEYFTKRVSIIIVLFGLSLLLCGKKITKEIAMPLGYLITMVPLPYVLYNSIAFPLRLASTKLSGALLNIVDVPTATEGNIIYIPNCTLEMVTACSGIRSLITLMAMAFLIAYFVKSGPYFKGILFLSSIPVTVVTNTLRVTLLGIVAYAFGGKAAESAFHNLSGIFTYLVGFLSFFILIRIYDAIESLREP